MLSEKATYRKYALYATSLIKKDKEKEKMKKNTE